VFTNRSTSCEFGRGAATENVYFSIGCAFYIDSGERKSRKSRVQQNQNQTRVCFQLAAANTETRVVCEKKIGL
jgi:hypothetical protein